MKNRLERAEADGEITAGSAGTQWYIGQGGTGGDAGSGQAERFLGKNSVFSFQ